MQKEIKDDSDNYIDSDLEISNLKVSLRVLMLKVTKLEVFET